MWFKCKASPEEGSPSALGVGVVECVWGRGGIDQEELIEKRTPRKIQALDVCGGGRGVFFPFCAGSAPSP